MPTKKSLEKKADLKLALAKAIDLISTENEAKAKRVEILAIGKDDFPPI